MSDGASDGENALQESTEAAPPRIYRAGLGLPAAVIIRSAPGSSRSAQRSLEPSSSCEASGSNAIQISAHKDDGYDSTSTSLPREVAWREWHINPAKHGPERYTRPPVFLPSSQNYDELGRSLDQGVSVEIDSGGMRKKKKEDGEVGVENGVTVAGWYLALAQSKTGQASSSSPSSRPTPVVGNTVENPSVSNVIESKSRASAPIIVVDDDDEDVDGGQSDTPTSGPAFTRTANSAPPAKPIRIHRREWFIRRALASSSAQDPTTSSSDGSGPSLSATPVPKSTTIGSMLNILPAQPRVTAPQYHLGPENKGYEILRRKLGWEGGGLGRPADWEQSQAEGQVRGQEQTQVQAQKVAVGLGSGDKGKSVKRDVVEVHEDEQGRQIVDLTADSDSERSSFANDDEEGEESRAGGPGRTAPVPTTLKLDKLGLGHKRSIPYAGNGLGAESRKKKVTHSIQEIREAQRRASYRSSPSSMGGSGELGKRGKIKWKERDKREREERRRLAAALNA